MSSMMVLYLGLLLFSFSITSVLIVPYINLLYKLKFLRKIQKTKDFQGKRSVIFDKFNQSKAGTPVGGGLLIVFIVFILYLLLFPILQRLGVYISRLYQMNDELNVIFFTFTSFCILGLYDDLMKFFGLADVGIFGLRLRHKLFIQCVLGLIIGAMLFQNLKIDFVNIPFMEVYKLGWLYIPFSAFVIVAFTNAFNITDGLDGLSSGVALICLFAFWILSYATLDTPLSVFIALWIGSLLAFLYFNVYPARIFLGDGGALAFGATLAVVGLLIGKIVAVVVIGGIFVLEISSSLLQIFSKKVFRRKLFTVAPLHLWLRNSGWEEPKIVMRAWLAGIILAIFGIWLALI